MVREGLLMELRAAMHKARKQGVSIRHEGLRVKSNGDTHSVSIEVVPIKSGMRERHFLVLFQDMDQRTPSEAVVTKVRSTKAEPGENDRAAGAGVDGDQGVHAIGVEDLEDANENSRPRTRKSNRATRSCNPPTRNWKRPRKNCSPPTRADHGQRGVAKPQ